MHLQLVQRWGIGLNLVRVTVRFSGIANSASACKYLCLKIVFSLLMNSRCFAVAKCAQITVFKKLCCFAIFIRPVEKTTTTNKQAKRRFGPPVASHPASNDFISNVLFKQWASAACLATFISVHQAMRIVMATAHIHVRNNKLLSMI